MQSHQQALNAFGPYHLQTEDALRGRVYAERELRNFDEALKLQEQLEATAARTSGVGAVGVAAMARDRAELLMSAGRPAESLKQVLAALPKCNSDLGPNQADCRELEFCKVNAMLQLGMTLRASEELPLLAAIAEDRKSPALGTGTLLLMLRIDSSSTGSDGARSALFERVKSLADPRSGVALSANLRTKALLVLAEARLRAQDPAEAQRWITKALAIQRRDDGSVPTTKLAALAKSLLGVSLLQRGQVGTALESLSEAHDDLSKLNGPDDPATCLSALNVAIGLETAGRRKEALAVVKRVEPILRVAMGAEAPTYQRSKELQERLERDI
jgi:tetratricopeptide (TPR) repeat protein